MLMGTVNIAANIESSVSEILGNGRFGILYKWGDIAELAEKIADVWNKKINIENMTAAAQNSMNRFHPDNVIADIKVITLA
jgi:glycosyltransferase involved in cell wall biosynthesis